MRAYALGEWSVRSPVPARKPGPTSFVPEVRWDVGSVQNVAVDDEHPSIARTVGPGALASSYSISVLDPRRPVQ